MPSPISDYALIGDGRSAALVSKTGSIDFLCLPHFDSDACFAALLGQDRNGCWRLAPTGYVRKVERRYRGNTLVLETDFATEGGEVRLIDFMAWDAPEPVLVRIAEGLKGEVEVESLVRLRFDYGRTPPWIEASGREACANVGPHQVVLHAPAPVGAHDGDLHTRVTVRRGERLAFSLAYAPSHAPAPKRRNATALLKDTERAWGEWIARFDKPSRWAGPIRRSLLTLRGLVDRTTGGLVAAPSMGLPEVPGGAMNWDYRYCWLRDATFTLTALINAGFHEEATRWRDWILRAVAGKPDALQIVYRIDGSRRLDERHADWLGGYEGSRPVLIGNAASGQVQLDVFGELIDSFHVAERGGVARTARDLAVERALVEHLEGA